MLLKEKGMDNITLDDVREKYGENIFNFINQEKERLLEVLKLEILKRKLNDKEFKNSYNAIIDQIENNETTAIKGALKLLDE